VLGQDLLAFHYQGRETLLYPLLARQLAERLRIADVDLPPGDELQEMARRYLATSGDVQDIYREIRVVLRELEPLPVPRPLAQLADIPELRLFVTTTFDFMMERAINDARYDGQRQTLVFSYAPNDKQDLPREFERLHRPTVYQLMGRFSSTPHSYAVTHEDTLLFIQSLQVKTEDSPHFLFDKLKHSNLLIVGSHIADWLASFFIRGAGGGRHVEIPVELGGDGNARGSVLFLERFSGGTRIYRGQGAVGFVSDLCRRWRDQQPTREPAPPEAVRDFQSGAVYLSYASADADSAASLRDALDNDGVDVVFDEDDAPISEKWEKKLRSFVSECSVFMPVVSQRALHADRRFFRSQWVEAILEAAKTVPSGRFVLPVVVDASAPSERPIPEEFGKLDYERWTSDQPNSKLVETVVQLQRDYRSASFA
jgi:hypothetical protein